MKGNPLLTSILLLGITYSSRAQEFSYTHYDISDGLAGSVVYCIAQDKDGFLWIGTETGVSRFDGTHFKNFTVAEGLSDIEILNMFGDSKGRVWMAPFRKSVCYYYQGRIHNQENDSLLRSIRLRGNIENYAEDTQGNILMQERTALHLLSANGSISQYDSIDGQPIQCASISSSADGHFLVQEGGRIYELGPKGFVLQRNIRLPDVAPFFIAMNASGLICRSGKTHTTIELFRTNKEIALPLDPVHFPHVNYSTIGDSLFYFNELKGSVEYNAYTGKFTRFLAGIVVSRAFRDNMGNTWFATLGHGIFRLNSDEFRTIHVSAPGMEESSIHAVARIGNYLVLGDNHNYIFRFLLPDLKSHTSGTITGTSKNRILDLGRMSGKYFWVASDRGIDEADFDLHRIREGRMGVKSVWKKNDSLLIIGTGQGAGLFNLKQFRMTDTLWRDRTTTIYERKDTIYIGTLAGLYIIGPDRTIAYLGNNVPFLKKRISGLTAATDGILWISSSDAGVIGYKNGREVVRLDKAHGLTSDICRTLVVHNNFLWIGTDKGLNRVRLDQPGYAVTQYNSNDGLGSDIVNSIYADSSMIYVGTAAGLSYFNETRVGVTEGCSLHLTSVSNAGKERIGDSVHLLIPYSDKHIRLEFAGISYRSVGSIRYRYRLVGLDTGWRETRETFLEYPTLPSGKYIFQLQAVNKFGVSSVMLTLPFEVVTPFWQAPWFYVLVIAGALALIWMAVSFRIENIRRRQREKDQLNLRLVEMEHTALQAQMNPHFIFNCLNSIQQYIFNQEMLAANRYLTGFARLIRATLQHSSKAFILLSEEIDYLSSYLSLEKLRFKQKMEYSIEVDPAIRSEEILIPPMLIQPFVENSMRHGLRHKTTGNGYIRIKFNLEVNRIRVTVEDNGIGRQQAATYKTQEHIEYQSKGMNLTADRIRLMNMKYSDSIHIEVTDLKDGAGSGVGTRVVMQFPLFHLTNQNETPYDPNNTRR